MPIYESILIALAALVSLALALLALAKLVTSVFSSDRFKVIKRTVWVSTPRGTVYFYKTKEKAMAHGDTDFIKKFVYYETVIDTSKTTEEWWDWYFAYKVPGRAPWDSLGFLEKVWTAPRLRKHIARIDFVEKEGKR